MAPDTTTSTLEAKSALWNIIDTTCGNPSDTLSVLELLRSCTSPQPLRMYNHHMFLVSLCHIPFYLGMLPFAPQPEFPCYFFVCHIRLQEEAVGGGGGHHPEPLGGRVRAFWCTAHYHLSHSEILCYRCSSRTPTPTWRPSTTFSSRCSPPPR